MSDVAIEPSLLMPAGLVAGFLALTLAILVAGELVLSRRRVRRSLQPVRHAHVTGADLRTKELARPLTQRVLLPGLAGVERLLLRFTPGAVVDRLDTELVHAGSPGAWDGPRVLALKVGTAVTLALAGGAGLAGLGFGPLRTLTVVPFLAVVGYYLPEWILRSRSGVRQQAVRRALPDALDLMSITVEAGLGFDAAMERVSREMGGPLGEELYRVVQEMRLGKGRGEALRDLTDRTTVDELRSFVLAMVQAEIFGISISRVLHVQAEELRIRRRQLAEEQAQQLPVKIVFPLVLCIFPAMFVILLGPAAIAIYENLIGL